MRNKSSFLLASLFFTTSLVSTKAGAKSLPDIEVNMQVLQQIRETEEYIPSSNKPIEKEVVVKEQEVIEQKPAEEEIIESEAIEIMPEENLPASLPEEDEQFDEQVQEVQIKPEEKQTEEIVVNEEVIEPKEQAQSEEKVVLPEAVEDAVEESEAVIADDSETIEIDEDSDLVDRTPIVIKPEDIKASEEEPEQIANVAEPQKEPEKKKGLFGIIGGWFSGDDKADKNKIIVENKAIQKDDSVRESAPVKEVLVENIDAPESNDDVSEVEILSENDLPSTIEDIPEEPVLTKEEMALKPLEKESDGKFWDVFKKSQPEDESPVKTSEILQQNSQENEFDVVDDNVVAEEVKKTEEVVKEQVAPVKVIMPNEVAVLEEPREIPLPILRPEYLTKQAEITEVEEKEEEVISEEVAEIKEPEVEEVAVKEDVIKPEVAEEVVKAEEPKTEEVVIPEDVAPVEKVEIAKPEEVDAEKMAAEEEKSEEKQEVVELEEEVLSEDDKKVSKLNNDFVESSPEIPQVANVVNDPNLPEMAEPSGPTIKRVKRKEQSLWEKAKSYWPFNEEENSKEKEDNLVSKEQQEMPEVVSEVMQEAEVDLSQNEEEQVASQESLEQPVLGEVVDSPAEEVADTEQEIVEEAQEVAAEEQQAVDENLEEGGKEQVETASVDISKIESFDLNNKGVLLTIGFNQFEADMSEEDLARLDVLSRQLKASPNKKAKIICYAKSVGEHSAAARRISLQRAIAIRARMILNGVDSVRINVQAMGGDRQDSANPDRADIYIVDQDAS